MQLAFDKYLDFKTQISFAISSQVSLNPNSISQKNQNYDEVNSVKFAEKGTL